MDRVLLDTDIYSEVLKGHNTTVVANAAEYRTVSGPLAISVITVLEIVKGLHRVQRQDQLIRFLRTLQSVEVLRLEIEQAVLAGQIYADLDRAGQPIGRADPMIAAIALHDDRTLVTGNTQHFERIRALGYPLRLADWRIKPESI